MPLLSSRMPPRLTVLFFFPAAPPPCCCVRPLTAAPPASFDVLTARPLAHCSLSATMPPLDPMSPLPIAPPLSKWLHACSVTPPSSLRNASPLHGHHPRHVPPHASVHRRLFARSVQARRPSRVRSSPTSGSSRSHLTSQSQSSSRWRCTAHRRSASAAPPPLPLPPCPAPLTSDVSNVARRSPTSARERPPSKRRSQ